MYMYVYIYINIHICTRSCEFKLTRCIHVTPYVCMSTYISAPDPVDSNGPEWLSFFGCMYVSTYCDLQINWNTLRRGSVVNWYQKPLKAVESRWKPLKCSSFFASRSMHVCQHTYLTQNLWIQNWPEICFIFWCMYVHMCICVCISTYLSAPDPFDWNLQESLSFWDVCRYLYKFVCVYVLYIYIYIYIYLCVCMCVCMYVYQHTYLPQIL
jgi:hypothetical protein